jgi:hypothetical protein
MYNTDKLRAATARGQPLNLEDNRKTPMPFLEWVDRVYDPDELLASFRASRLGSLFRRVIERARRLPLARSA